jgi:hypothetical protein
LATVVGDSYEVTPDATIVPIIYSEAFATQKKDLANKFMVAYMKGVRDYNDAYRKDKNRGEITKILANAVKMDPVLVERMRKGGWTPTRRSIRNGSSLYRISCSTINMCRKKSISTRSSIPASRSMASNN